MVTRVFVLAALALRVLSLDAATGPAPQPAQTMYADALAKEQAVRTALTPESAPATVLKAVRTVVEEYEALVRAYPTSGYCDDALWYAGELSLDAFDKFGAAQDRNTGVRLLRTLATEYPLSKFARQVPEQLSRAGNAGTGKPEPITAGQPKAVAASLPPALPATPPAAAATAAPSLKIATIKDIRRAVLQDVVRVVIELDGEAPFHEERLEDPPRIFLDLAATRAAPALTDQTIRFDGDNEVVRQIRLGRHPNNTTRVVLEAAGVSSFSVYPLYSPYRLVIDCVRALDRVEASASTLPPAPGIASAVKALPTARAAVPPAVLRSRPFAIRPLTVQPAVSADSSELLAAARLGATETVPSAAVAPLPAPPTTRPEPTASASALPAPPLPPSLPSPNVAGGFSIARQLGLSVSRIVIDPGHGGHDPGAKGGGMTEAELVLDVSLRLEKLLAKVPGLNVVLTRRTDEFVPLQERTAIANREHADLFLSIHANASTNPQARGVETYFLDIAKTFSEQTVAARENAENAASGRSMGDFPEFLKAIALDNKVDESRDLATIVQRGMVNTLKSTNKTVKDLGVRQAPFVVLIGAAMPSVLSEISFITNGPEAKLLRSSGYRQRIAEGLFSAIRKYQASLQNTRTAIAEHP